MGRAELRKFLAPKAYLFLSVPVVNGFLVLPLQPLRLPDFYGSRPAWNSWSFSRFALTGEEPNGKLPPGIKRA